MSNETLRYWIRPRSTRVQRKLIRYSVVWGALSFVSGVLFTWVSLPESLRQSEIATWKIASWVWLNAHGITIEGQQVGGLEMMFQRVSFIQEAPELRLLYALPPIFVLIAVLLVIVSLGGASRSPHIVQDGIHAALGYLIVAFAAVVVTDAAPSVFFATGLVVLLGGSLYIGSLLAARLPIPLFAVTGLGGLFAIGLVVLLTVGAIATIATPLAKVAAIGGGAGIVLVWLAGQF